MSAFAKARDRALLAILSNWPDVREAGAPIDGAFRSAAYRRAGLRDAALDAALDSLAGAGLIAIEAQGDRIIARPIAGGEPGGDRR